MVHRPELLTALENAPTGPRHLTAWRHMFVSHPPDQENNRGARWNPPGVAAIYLSEERSGAIAEGDHAVSVQPFKPRVRRWIYAIDVTLENVVDISGIHDLDAVGLTEADIASDDFSNCQEVGGAANWLGRDGLIVPSARGKFLNLVIYPVHRDPAAIFEFGPGEEIH